MKRLILGFILCATGATAMQKREVIGTLMLTGGYYSIFALFDEQAKTLMNYKKKDALLMMGVGLHAAGLITLAPSVLKSSNPATAAKFVLGSLSMAKALHLAQQARFHYAQFIKNKQHEDEIKSIMLTTGASSCAAFGVCAIAWAMHDTMSD